MNGTVIVSHGRSGARAISNAIQLANKMAEVDINGLIVQNLRAFSKQSVSAWNAGTEETVED